MTTARVEDYVFKTEPYQHQLEAFLKSRREQGYALLMEQGTGKSKVAVDTAVYLYNIGAIDAVIVAAPKGVDRNWVRNEFPAHAPMAEEMLRMACYNAQNKTKAAQRAIQDLFEPGYMGLRVLTFNYEAVRTDKGFDLVRTFVNTYRCLFICDESHRIKTPNAQQTKRIMKLAKHAKYRRILTGTAFTQGPFDAYSQYRFLDDDFWPMASFQAFKHTFGEFVRELNHSTGKEYDRLICYRNLEKLTKLIQPLSFRVTKDECLDLPDKVYMRRSVEMSPEQKKLYLTMQEQFVLEFMGQEISAPAVLTRLLRLQQILGGFVPIVTGKKVKNSLETDLGTLYEYVDEIETRPIEGPNYRINAVKEICDEAQHKVIVFCRFTSEVVAVAEALRKEYGAETVVTYYGATSDADRELAIDRFQDVARDEKGNAYEEVSPVKFFVANPAAAGTGLTLTKANDVIYYSNDFRLDTRLQSEDRAHRIGQQHKVTYWDLECEGTIDSDIITALLSKKSIADQLNGDKPTAWLQSIPALSA